jgi:GntR family transcriptional repressor for pyruvate dehydrogenase complex
LDSGTVYWSYQSCQFLSRPLLWAFTGTDHAELADLMEARVFMERDLAGLAAERATPEELAD